MTDHDSGGLGGRTLRVLYRLVLFQFLRLSSHLYPMIVLALTTEHSLWIVSNLPKKTGPLGYVTAVFETLRLLYLWDWEHMEKP